ncbi:tyrosine-protein kinase Fer-like isoform X2 [Glandiceps talaboti]
MGFGTDLQSKASHDAILKLSDREIRLLETMKKCFTLRAKYDRDYAQALSGFVTIAGKLDNDNDTHSSQIFMAWQTMVKETEQVCRNLKKNADSINDNVLNKLTTLIREKIDSKKHYNQARHKIDSEFLTLSDEVEDNYNKYMKFAKETKDCRTKYDDALNKGKEKDIEKAKEKFRKSTVKLHKIHNDYVFAIMQAQTHQEHYNTTLLPQLLDMHQQAQESQVSQIKELLAKFADLTNTGNEDYRNIQETIGTSISEIQPQTEYLTFIEQYSGDPPIPTVFEFKTEVQSEYTDSYLTANEVVLDNLTIEGVTHKRTELEDLLQKCHDSINEKEKEIDNLNVEINSISPTEAEDNMIDDLFEKQKCLREAIKELGELKCKAAKMSVQFEVVDRKIAELGQAVPPAGIEFAYADVSNDPEPSEPRTKTDTLGKIGKKKGIATMFRKNKKSDSGGGDDTPPKQDQNDGEEYSEVEAIRTLDDEEWYHGCIPRPEAIELLRNDGEFLVRQRGDDPDQYVLSVKWQDKHKHFPIQNKEGQFRLEGEAFDSIGQLINCQLRTSKPVTKASGAILRTPIVRQWDLTHDDIIIGDFLGKGNFGDVVKGILKKDRTPVAVKTCRENVDPSVRQKFLMEARILRQYDHPNIVKLVGVCTERHPIYIVMEFVAGGDFLSFLRNKGGSQTIGQLVRMSENAAAGMAYLASMKCIHRDLAARNCLVGDRDVVKISDFGMSRQEDDGIYTVSGGMKQIPIKWTAPEAMNYGEYTIECDVWSYGILLWEIFSRGNNPYPGLNNAVAREKIENGYRMTAPDGTPSEVYEIMKQCWQYHPQDRITFADIHKSLKRVCKIYK